MENMSFAVSSFTPRQAARACHVAPFPGMMFQQQKCRFAGAGRSFLEAAETLAVLALQREKLTAGALIPGWLVGRKGEPARLGLLPLRRGPAARHQPLWHRRRSPPCQPEPVPAN